MMKTIFKIVPVIIGLIFVLSGSLFCQTKLEEVKRQGVLHMTAGRYGEAVEQFNKYIVANPQIAEGYNLRGLCFEKRQEYQYSVLDFRRAVSLDPANAEYKINLNRVLQVWHKILYDKIEGHKREIAIDPKVPWNYLEIGKCYRWLEIWDFAEQWYDQYLKRDDNASPDEIIRYTEILAKTGSLTKGEKILRKFVDRYPTDWRLWSRYGYFTYWLGKYNIAKNAFETSLSFKPFFKEAEDGLDLVKNQGYMVQYQPRAFEKVYPIDKYYKILSDKPSDDETRFLLIEELITAERYEEAHQQLQYLEPNYKDEDRFKKLAEKVNTVRTEVYASKIEELKAVLKEFPESREAVRKLTEYYANLQQYQDAEDILKPYLEKVPDDNEMRFYYARILSYDRKFELSYPEVKKVLENDPKNNQAKLLAGQLGVWLKTDSTESRKYLEEVEKDEPQNINALITLGTYFFNRHDLVTAQSYVEKANKVDPDNADLLQLNTIIEQQRIRDERDRMWKVLGEGQTLAKDKKYEESLPYYEEFIKKGEPTELIYTEYADVLTQCKKYDQATAVFDSLLVKNYNFNYDRQRAKLYFWSGDSLKANSEFIRLAQAKPDDIETQVYLGDTYTKLKKYDEARQAYYKVRDTAPEEYKIEDRIGWLPPTPDSFRGIVSSITGGMFTYLLVTPHFYYFGDNMEYYYLYGGLGVETSLHKYVSIAGIFDRGSFGNSNGSVVFTTLKGGLYIKPNDRLLLGAQYGSMYSAGLINDPVWDAFINYEQEGRVKASLSYNKADAATILYSPYLVYNRLTAHNVKLELTYFIIEKLKFSGYYQLIFSNAGTVNYNNQVQTLKANVGNNFQARVGKYFYPELCVGYEYFYSDYKYTLPVYYSPQEFSSHSIWAEWQIIKDPVWDILVGGKIGYIPQSDYIVRDANIQIQWQIYQKLKLRLSGFVGDSFRFDSNYRSSSIYISAFWLL